MFIHSILTYVW